MFTDSNWTGFIYMLIFAFFVYLRDCTALVGRKKIRAVFLIILLSFSRAAIISSLFVLFYSFFVRQSKNTKRAIMVGLILFALFSVTAFIAVLSKDDSFSTKLTLLHGLEYYLRHADIPALLIGNGTLAASLNTSLLGDIGYSAHLYIIIKILDLGLVGLMFDFLYLLVINSISRNAFMYVLLPFCLCGLSMCPTNLSMMYVFAGLMIFIEECRRSGTWT